MIGKDTPSYLCEFQTGVQLVTSPEEVQRLHDIGVRFTNLGEVCDDQEFGDSCNTDCLHFRQGTCPMVVVHDFRGARWHVHYHEVHHNH